MSLLWYTYQARLPAEYLPSRGLSYCGYETNIFSKRVSIFCMPPLPALVGIGFLYWFVCLSVCLSSCLVIYAYHSKHFPHS